MSNVKMCVGARSDTPYYMKHFDTQLYSIEELCYIITQNAFLLEEEDFDDNLIEWIRDRLHLNPLSDMLINLKNGKAGLFEIVMTILGYVGYNTEKEMREVRSLLEQSSHMDQFDKKLNKARMYLDQGKLSSAEEEYRYLEDSLPDGALNELAVVYHNQGVILARKFYFMEAAERFRKEYDIAHTKSALMSYMYAVRICMTEKQYIDYMADNKDAYLLSMELEKKMSDAGLIYDAGEDKHQLATLSVYKAEGNLTAYKDGMNGIIRNMKEEYRGMCS